MQRHGPRHFTAYAITTLLYLCVIAAMYYAQTQHFVSSKESKEKVIQISLSTFVPEVPEESKKEVFEKPVVEPEVKEEPIVEEVIPEPVVQKVIEKPVTEKPILKKPMVEKPKKIIKKKVKKKKIVKKTKKKSVKKKTVKTKRKKKASKRQASSKHSKSSPAERNAFWSGVRRKIDKHKFYPRIAKKRRMEGAVKVHFTVLANGTVANILLKGPKIFHNSARDAVKSAFPIDVKKSPITLPASINITLNYQIR